LFVRALQISVAVFAQLAHHTELAEILPFKFLSLGKLMDQWLEASGDELIDGLCRDLASIAGGRLGGLVDSFMA
jgi:hypothetical protein